MYSRPHSPRRLPTRWWLLGRALGAGSLAFLLSLLLPIVPAALAGGPVTVTITISLNPSTVDVEAGTTITWRNTDSQRHRIRSHSGPVEFDSGNLEPGEAFSMSFEVAGTYSYWDDRDRENTAYHGTIVVADTPAPPPPGASPTTTAPGGSGTATGPVTVQVVNRTYQPASLVVDPGTTVRWENIDDRPHTVTANDRSFDSGIFSTGGGYSRTFTTPGTFEYFCTLHPDMVATVSVRGSGGAVPPPPPPPAEPAPAPTPSPAPQPAAPGDVTIFDNGFTPATLSVAVGSTVTWSNTGSLPHTVTDGAGAFDSGVLMASGTYRRTFTTSGTYLYFCSLHPEMKGTILVADATGNAPPPAPVVNDNTGTTPGATTSAPAVKSDVKIVDNGYRPQKISVAAGSTITWSNTGSLPHTVSARDGAFDSGILMSGDGYRRTFGQPGSFEYFCTIHPGMVGTVVVTPGGTPTGTASAGGDGVVRAEGNEDAAGTTEGATNSPDTAPSENQELLESVSIVDFDYEPRSLRVAAGNTVVWTNQDELPHTVTAADWFDSGILNTGDVFRWTFTAPGTYEYICTLHPDMVGTVVVEEAAPSPDGQLPTVGAASPISGSSSGPPSLLVAVIMAAGLALAGVGMAVAVGLFSRAAVSENQAAR